jgi:hypothetical protein
MVLADKKIENKNTEIISDHISKIIKSLKEKKIFSFWTFADRSGFKKIKNMSFKDMQKTMKSDVEKYKNRQICEIKIMTHSKPNEYGTWLVVGIWAITTDNEANMEGKGVKDNGCGIKWTIDDFKVTKFSLKLVEAIMHVIADGKHSCSSMTGFHIEKILKDLKNKKIDLSDHLSPLAGLV